MHVMGCVCAWYVWQLGPFNTAWFCCKQSWCYGIQVAMVLPVVASNGRIAHAHVKTSQSAGLDIQVQLPNGQVIRVDPKQRQENDYLEQDEDEFGPKGRVIDADWREVH